MRRLLWWVLGLVLVIGGVAMALSSGTRAADFGWTAYAPLSEESDWYMAWGDGSALILTRWQQAGCALAVIGLLVIAARIGFQLGRRRAAVREQP